MSSEQIQKFINEATLSINGGQFDQAAKLAGEALALDPNCSDAMVIQAIAFSQTGRSEQATAVFRNALQVDPHNPKTHFNFAVHLYGMGLKNDALAEAQTTANLDPSHVSAANLVGQLQQELGLTTSAPPIPTMSRPEQISMPMPGFESSLRGHSMDFIAKNDGVWTFTGWFLSLSNLVIFGVTTAMMLPFFEKVMAAAASGSRTSPDFASPVPVGLSIISWLVILLMITWMAMDIADRRGNWIWIVPGAICTVCCGLGWLILPIYLLAGRRPL
ncbi:MAG: tetratricopeptide repeat protein [Armatimonadetes bacterium]|nr:tetratricopeptide repeat protein [Armatimonadota bacterium]